MPQTTIYALVMLAAGIGIPVFAALNAALGTRIGSPVAAVVILLTVALLASCAILLFTSPSALRMVPGAPRHLLLGGLLAAFYMLSITFIAPRFGVGNAVFFVLLGQLISAAAIDHFGLFGARVSPLSATRALGILLMGAGVFVTQKI